MKDINQIIKKITELTTKIETEYPELYEHLEEMPVTLSGSSDPDLDKKALLEYLESLKLLLEHHIETHGKKGK